MKNAAAAWRNVAAKGENGDNMASKRSDNGSEIAENDGINRRAPLINIINIISIT